MAEAEALLPAALPRGPAVPVLFAAAGDRAARRLVEFLTAEVRNPNTRAAYAHAVNCFDAWCNHHGVALETLQPVHVAAYVEGLGRELSKPSVKQHLAALKALGDYLVTGGVLPANPAAAVRGPKYVIRTGKTPVLSAAETRDLFASIDTLSVSGLRDRALIGVMAYSFARVSAALGMDVGDYAQQGKRWWLRLHEKGGKDHAVPCHHLAEEYLDAYLLAAGIAGDKHGPLFRAVGPDRRLSDRRLDRRHALAMVKRRAAAAGLGDAIGCHTFRATGITNFLENGGSVERAQAIAAHESPRTTKLYDRTRDALTLDDIERIRF